MELKADLYRYYARLRAEDPVHETARGVWLLTRYDDVCAALRDPRLGRKGIIESIARQNGAREPSACPMRFQDPPRYTELRNLIGKVFNPGLLDGMRPRIQQIVDGLLGAARDAGGMDLVAGLGLAVSVQVILELLGVPAADHEQFCAWSHDMTQSLDAAAGAEVSARGAAAQQAIDDYFRALVAERRRCPRHDLVSALIAAEHGGKRLYDAELLDICGLLFVAGHATAVDLIGNGVLSLLLQPSELRRLRDEPGLLASAVEELLRYESPVQRVGRVANTEVELRGKLIPKGAVVFAVLGAANRDPALYGEPDRLDLARRHNRHVAFGYGARTCIGAALARLEGQIAIGTLLTRLPTLALTGDLPQWRDSHDTRGLRQLRVTF
jgi:pimeloyl-[acyl-carrier protein] synthase